MFPKYPVFIVKSKYNKCWCLFINCCEYCSGFSMCALLGTLIFVLVLLFFLRKPVKKIPYRHEVHPVEEIDICTSRKHKILS
jgi:hypothetical protein